ncbi:MAG: 6-phosphogluconolactonase [Ectothiorhodospiraceae bacterium]|nr:6-phosphogluconolactonase [Chromatiales bacterium]MCP5153304.1 6-phosphogluconolactonase [Ectothiorhodospiraceae bacterium]
MHLTILPDAESVAREGARLIAARARAAVAERGTFSLALSGGRTPLRMLALLRDMDLPWAAVDVLQVDERVAPAGDADRNLTALHAALVANGPLPAERLHPMPVESTALARACREYARSLRQIAPDGLDLVHLGLGSDGHTASLVPEDRALGEHRALVATTDPYQGRVRMTLTYPALDAARERLWLVTGADKRPALARLLAGDRTIPAGAVDAAASLVVADAEAAPAPR